MGGVVSMRVTCETHSQAAEQQHACAAAAWFPPSCSPLRPYELLRPSALQPGQAFSLAPPEAGLLLFRHA